MNYQIKLASFNDIQLMVEWAGQEQMSNAHALVYYDNGIKGYGVIRACHQGYKIGPLFASLHLNFFMP